MSWKDEDVAQEAWADADIAEAPKRPATSLPSRIIEGMSDPVIGAAQIADKVLVNPIPTGGHFHNSASGFASLIR